MSTNRIFGMKRLVYWCAGGLLCVNFVPHALPSIIRWSSEADRIEAPIELVAHVRKIAASMGLSNTERVQVFVNRGFSSLCGGSTALPMGAVIGLPRTVLFRSPKDVHKCDIAVKGEPVDWESEEGEQLLKILPPSAKLINFRIAHEVAHLKSNDFVYHTLLSPAVLVCGYHFALFLSKSMFPGRIVAAFPLLFSLALVAQVQISSTIHHWQEYRADKMAAVCRRSYAEGGAELMRRGMQLESILREPPSRYSLERFTASFKSHPSYRDRLERLNDLLALSGNDYDYVGR
ncbi:transmembrane protein 177-like [Halichondria panicea]|uniref:transmembrane protein 177-like n=1 Tax=Halichondria panicea TaxID=6063 RepID=UPI00312B657B